MADNETFSLIEFIKNKNFRGFSVFLLVAFLFLLLTKFSKTYTAPLQFDVEVKGLEDEVTLVGDNIAQITVMVESRGFNLVPYMFYNPNDIILDVKKDLKSNGEVYTWNVKEHRFKFKEMLGNAFNIVSIDPEMATFTFERLQSKKVPVKLETNFEFATGYDVVDFISVDQDSIKVVGSVNELLKITEITTVPIERTGIKTDINEKVELFIPDSLNVEIYPKAVKITAIVKPFTEGVVEVPIRVKNIPEGKTINFFPKSVSVYFAVNLDDYKAVKASDFTVECDYESISSEKQSFIVAEVTKHPNSVKRIRLKQQRIEFVRL